MALSHSPRIVTDNLVLCLDAGNTKSYPGSGTTWTDLSGRGNTGTLTNGPTFSSANGGSIVFDGVDDYATIPASSFFDWGTGDFAFECWVKWTSSSWFLSLETRNTTSGTYLLYGNNTAVYWYVNDGAQISGSAISIGVWYNFAVTRISGSTKMYRNGEQTGSTYIDSYNYQTGGSGLVRIGRNNGNDYAGQQLSNIKIYKGKGLTAAEVSQNFNALRGRFGI